MRFTMTSFSAVLLLSLTLSCGDRNKNKSEKDDQVSTQAQQKDEKASEEAGKVTGENEIDKTTAARAGRETAGGETERRTAELSTAELQLRAARSGAGATPSLLDALPAGTLFYMTITETAQSLAAKKKSALFRLAEEPEFKKFGEYIQEIQAQRDGGAQKKMMRELEQRIGISLIDPKPKPGHVELAIQGVDLFAPVPLPQLVLSLDSTEWSADKLFQFIDGMLEFMAENNPIFPKIEKAQITLRDNTPARAYYVQEYETVKLCLFSKGSRIYGALGENTANLLLANLAAPPAQGLSRDATFQKVKGRLGPHADRSLMYVNIKAIKNLALGVAAMQAPAQALHIQQMADSLGLNGIQAYGVSTGLDDDGKSFQTRTFLSAPAPRRGVAKLFDLKRLDKKALMDLPRETTWGFVVGLPIQELYRELWTALPALGVNKAQYDAGLLQGQQKLGFHIENDLLPSLGDSIALSVSVDPRRLLPDVTAVLALKDQAKFKDCITQMRAFLARFTPEEMQARMRRSPLGINIGSLIDKRFSQAVPLPGGRGQGQGQGIIRYLPIPNTPLSPSYCIIDGRLFVSATLDGLHRNLTSRFAGKSYRDSPALQGQLAQLPPGAATVTVLDVKGLFAYACAQLRPRMPGWLAQARGSGMVPFDLDALYAALPAQQTVEKHLLADATHRIVDGEGISSHTVSMLDGTTRLGFMAGFVGGGAGVLLPNVIAGMKTGRKTAKKIRALEALSAYSKTQAIHQNKFKRYGTLADLKAANYLDAEVADATSPTGPGYKGYYFTEPMEFAESPKKFWYQLIAAPQNPKAGDMMYLINQAAKIWQKEATAATPAVRVVDPDAAGWWITGE